jgi:hypothetical protein
MTNVKWRFWLICVAAFVGFCVPVALRSLPATVEVNTWVVVLSCPPLLATATVDPSWSSILLIIAPLNALFYGGLVGLALSGVRARTARS